MALEKNGYNIPFGQGLDTKSDPKQVVAGKMLSLTNVVFQSGDLNKRNGFGALTTLPTNTDNTTLTTLNNALLATGSSLYAYSSETNQWFNRGTVQPVSLDVTPLVRNAGSQVAPDIAIASSGLSCVVYKDATGLYYQVQDVDGQVIVSQTTLPATATCGRVYVLGRYFLVTFFATVSAATHLQCIAIPINNPASPGAATDISSQVSGLAAGYGGIVHNDTFYVAWNGSDIGGAIRMASLNSTLTQSATITKANRTADLMSVTVDDSGASPVIWCSFWETAGNTGYAFAVNQILVSVLAPTQIIAALELQSMTSIATAGVLTVYYEVQNTYSYGTNPATNYIAYRTITNAGVLGTATTLIRSVGLASKAFYYNDVAYMLTAQSSTYQPTYFLINSSGNVLMKLAYGNGGGYAATQVLTTVTVTDDVAYLAYLFKDQLVSINKDVAPDFIGGIYASTGINLAKFEINTSGQINSEIANCLQLTGGILWQYDSVKPVEHGFHLWPEYCASTTSTSGGHLADGTYYYSFCYEWTDNAGNLHRSSPSIPISQVTTGGTTSTNTLKVPTLRLTYKTSPNYVRIVGYRYSVAQPIFYQFTSISSPTLNDTTVDSVTITDTLADSSILGNTILYTTGGVVENVAAPACNGSVVTPTRQWIINAENPNELWYSKRVLANTPVEFSDLFTYYVSPSSVTQGSSAGPCKVLAFMDDKLIIFKTNSPYYVTGRGPDDTGANNDFSDPIFINAPVGCENSNSIVTTPMGIMFQASKSGGIWLLGRNLQTSYVGAPVEAFNSLDVQSALTVPGTNEVRFTLTDGTMLMYDYYYDQWGSFTGVPSISSTIHNNIHTYLNSSGQVRQETPGEYLDGTRPVLMSFSTAWLKLTNLQGFQRAYFFYFLGNFKSPHKLNVEIAYDYDNSIRQTNLITPINIPNQFGEGTYFGSGTPYGGSSDIEQWRIFFQKQKCQSVRITVTEVFDSSYGMAPGAGFSMSGLNLVAGAKGIAPKLPANQSAG